MTAPAYAIRRKPDGRPYADCTANGQRHKVSLLLPGETAATPIGDAELHRRAALLVAAGSAAKPTTKDAWADAITWYGRMQAADGAGDGGQVAAGYVLERWATFAKSRGAMTPSELTKDMATLWVAELREAMAPSTVQRYITTARALTRRMVAEGVLREDPIKRWPRVKVPERAPVAISKEDARALAERITEEPNRSIILTMLSVGLRPADLTAMTWSNVDFTAGLLRWTQSKTRQAIEVPLPAMVLAVLRERRIANMVEPRIWPYNPPAIISRVKNMCRKALGKYVTPKQIRAYVVTTLLEAGASPYDVGRVTGHRSDAIAAYYARSAARASALVAPLAEAMSPLVVTPLSPHAENPR